MGTVTSEPSARRIVFPARECAALEPYALEAGPLAPGEVAGPTLVTLVSAGTELAGYLGQHPWSGFPLYPGYAAVFQVQAVGSEVQSLRPGDLAFVMGQHQSWQRAAAEQVLPLPVGLEPESALFARMMMVSMSTLTTTTARPPAKVLVMGLGPVGHLAAKVFAACGYELYAWDPAEGRRRIATQAGIGNVLTRPPTEYAELVGQVALVLECSGHEQAALTGCQMVQKRGEVVLIGVPWARKTDLTAHELLNRIFMQYVVVRSGWEWEVPRFPTEFRMNSLAGNLAAALRWLAEGRISVAGLWEKASPGDIAQVYQDLLHGRAERLVTILDWRNG